MSLQPDCPVDFVTVNENQARLNAGQVFAITIAWLLTGFILLPIILTGDFLLRAANLGKYSVLNKISALLIKLFSIKNKPVDLAPKRFAALVGFIFSISILVLSLTGYTGAAKIISSILVVFAVLEAFVAFCAGCYVYWFLIRITGRKKVK